MPERELSEKLKARLSAELRAGAPFRAPLASQARYATAAAPALPRHSQRLRLAMVATASLAVLVVAALAGPLQPRSWIVQSVGTLAGDRGAPIPTPVNQSRVTISPTPGRSPSAETTAAPRESPEPGESPSAHESAQPGQSPSGGDTSTGDGDQSSPSPSPSPGADH